MVLKSSDAYAFDFYSVTSYHDRILIANVQNGRFRQLYSIGNGAAED